MPTYAGRKVHLELRSAEFGQRSRESIETIEIDTVLSRWLNAGLTAEGVKALRRFADLDCWGPFSNSSMIRSFRRACKAAKVDPAPRVYDLRHSFATEMYRQTGGPKATAELLMHSPTSQMMDRYMNGGVAPRLKLAVKSFNTAVKSTETAGTRGWHRKRKAKKTA